MREPKFKIGDTFFVSSKPNQNNVPTLHLYLFVHQPSVYVITEIHQTKKEISYTLKCYRKEVKSFSVTESEMTEDELVKKNYARTLTEKMEQIHNEIIEEYNELIKEVNKKKLIDVLNA
jgi:hypothetical protein